MQYTTRYWLLFIPLLLAAFTYAPEKLLDPAVLAKQIKTSATTDKPVILNVGPSGPIKGSILIGNAEDPANKVRLQNQLKQIPKTQKVVLYCGCCKLEDCVNISEANKILSASGHDYKILNLPTDFYTDWLSPGYPME
ncbi:MAG: hypothetical protein MUF42_11295 [Cytophagaceae bacterium]|jgi:hypothetical protein|nr:hypothetical protein [Cytophagaceae bacterium]